MEKTGLNQANVLTFNDVPNAINALSHKVDELVCIIEKIISPSVEDKWFDIDEMRNYHPDKPSKPTVYYWASNNLIPCHKSGKKLRFLKSEIDTWLKEGRRKTTTEIAEHAGTYLKKIGGPNE